MPHQKNVVRSPKESSPFTDEDQLEVVTGSADLVVNQPIAKPANGQKISDTEWTPIATKSTKPKSTSKTPAAASKSPRASRSSSKNAKIKPTKTGVDKEPPASQSNLAK